MTMPFYAGQRLTAAELDAIVLQVQTLAGNTLINTTPAINLLTFANLTPGLTYALSGALFLTNGANATNPCYNPGGTFTGNLTFGAWSFVNSASLGASVVAINSVARFAVTTTTIPASTSVCTFVNGFVSVTGAGTFTWGASEGTAAQSFTVLAGSYLTLQQQSI